MGKHFNGIFESIDDMIESTKAWTRAQKPNPARAGMREARLAARQRKSWRLSKRRAAARKKSLAAFLKTAAMGPKVREDAKTIKGQRLARVDGAPTLADVALQSMTPGRYYTKRQIGFLIGKSSDAVGATILRGLVKPGYVRRRKLRKWVRLNGSKQMSIVGFMITDLGIARAKERAPLRAPVAGPDMASTV
jgi:hypothetical protein